jgi:hypothetical protein
MAAGLEQLDRDREVLAQHRKHEESSRSPLPPIGENEFISSTTNFKPSSSSSSSANKNAIVPFDARTGVVGKKPVKRRNSTKKRRKKKHSEYSPLPGWLQSYISPITMAIVCCTLMSILVVGTIIYAAISTS